MLRNVYVYFFTAICFCLFTAPEGVNGQNAALLHGSDLVASLSDETAGTTGEGSEDVIPPKNNQTVEMKRFKPGFNFNIGSTSWQFNFGGRIQTRFDYLNYPHDPVDNTGKLFVRRLRFKSDGHLFVPELGYKLEFDLLEMKILDLVLKWNVSDHFSIWAGQTKLPGNRERVISSQNLQLVDRSLLNSKFTLDRDIGIWFTHHWTYGRVVLKEMFAVSKGEGTDLIYNDKENLFTGLDYTFRVEVLPFGNFSGKGDYSEADLAREKTPKLSVGLTFDFNDHALKSNGQKGKILNQHGNLRSVFADAIFKYNGISILSEYVNRNTTGIFQDDPDGGVDFINPFYIGNAFNAQAGYLFRNNIEIASRFTLVHPMDFTGHNAMKEYTLGLSKYIKGHRIKIQSDVSMLREENRENTFRYRLQLELGI